MFGVQVFRGTVKVVVESQGHRLKFTTTWGKMFLKWSVRPRVRAMWLMTANACVIYSMTTSLTQRVQIDLLGSAAIWSLPFPPFRLSVPFSPYHLLFSCSFLLSHTFHSAHFFPAFHLSVPLKRPLFHIKGFFSRIYMSRRWHLPGGPKSDTSRTMWYMYERYHFLAHPVYTKLFAFIYHAQRKQKP